MSAAQLLRTAADPERALVFIQHIRLRCDVCGVIAQQSDLENTLWHGNMCPSCLTGSIFGTISASRLSDNFNKMLWSKLTKIGNDIADLNYQVKAAKKEYDAAIEEARSLSDRYKWIDRKELDSGINWRDIDFLF